MSPVSSPVQVPSTSFRSESSKEVNTPVQYTFPRFELQGQRKRGLAPPPPLRPPPGGYRILVLVGIPGSGKSTFASFLENLDWKVVNQDTLGSREKCRREAQQVLQQGGRVIVDRCNFDQLQRVTWIDLAVSLFLHSDACIAIWLDIPVDICQGRVQRRVGHPTLGAGHASAGIVKRMAGELRPPHCKEGFHTVLRCRGDQDLFDAVSLLYCTIGLDAAPGISGASATTGAGGGGFGGGIDIENAESCRESTVDFGVAIEPPWSHSCPGRVTAGTAAPAVHHSLEASRRSAGRAGKGETACHAHAAGDVPISPMAYRGSGPVLAWGGQQQVGSGSIGDRVGRMRSSVNNNVRTATHDAKSYPPLPSGSSAGNGNNTRRHTGDMKKQSPGSMQNTYKSSSLMSIAKLTPLPQAAASAPRHHPPKPKTRLFTPAEISANFAELQAPPRLLAPEDVLAAAARPNRSRLGPTAAAAAKRNREHQLAQSAVLPLGPKNLEGWTSRSTLTTRRNEGNESTCSSFCRLEEATATAAGLGYNHRDGAVAGGGDGSGKMDAPVSRVEGTVDVSNGEALLVLEDMFGGLLPSETVKSLLLESGNDLEKAVTDGFQVCEGLWGRGEDLASSSPPFSDATTTDAFPWSPPTSTGSTDTDGAREEFADVSQWTHKQIDTLTELCLAFEGTMSRESVVAALTASNHNATSAAQLLLEPVPGMPWERDAGRQNDGHGRGRGVVQSERRARPLRAGNRLLGATCVRAGPHGQSGVEEGEGGGGEEEAEGDEGLSSEEYRARANEAAEEMKSWFQKAAEAFTRGGRNGGAAAADPSRIGHRWKKSMEAANLRAARESFRERNPFIRVGHAHDGTLVFKVLRLPEPSQCSTPGQLSVDLHLLRRAEALSALEAVLYAIRQRAAATHNKALYNRSPALTPSLRREEHSDVAAAGQGCVASAAQGSPESFAAAMGEKIGIGGQAAVAPSTADAGAGIQNDRIVHVETFASLEVVVGRGAHSAAGVPRLKPSVTGYLAGKGFRAEAVEGDRARGVVVVRLC